MTTSFATPHLRDLREVLSDALQQTQDAIQRTHELLRGSDHLLDPDADPDTASDPAKANG